MRARSRIGNCLLAAGLWAGLGPAGAAQPPAAGAHLETFRSQRQLDKLVDAWSRLLAQRGVVAMSAAAIPAPPMAAPAPPESAGVVNPIDGSGAAANGNDSITNNQVQGVDEGDIVKRRGDFLIILRRGRLFSVRIGGDALQPVSRVDAYAPGSDPRGTWYDEMLVNNDTVVVIGYSYQRQATELGLFSLAADGTLHYRDTHYLRSNDYYDSRNYASRLIGNTLVFYTPLYLGGMREDRLIYPGLAARPQGDAEPVFRRLLPATAIYRADEGIDPLTDGVALHTVTRCELTGAAPRCTSTGVLGPRGRTFHVSRDAVYVWIAAGGKRQIGRVLRMPLDGGAVSALQVHGAPIDQLSFHEDAGGHLNVLVQSEGRGQGMWRSEWGAGQLALLRTPLSAFGTLQATTPDGAYRFLPPIAAGNRQNRFVGDWLLYGVAPYGWMRQAAGTPNPEPEPAYAVHYAQPNDPIRPLALGHWVQRIEAMGQDAVAVGPLKDDLVFSTIALGSDAAAPHGRFVAGSSRQSESRTHGFFYRRDDAAHGVIGLPVLRETPPEPREAGAGPSSATVLYLRNAALDLSRLGELAASPFRSVDDGCKASCVDWYGNARPIFIGPRVFALLGYELVEGRLADGNISERRRVNFTPSMK